MNIVFLTRRFYPEIGGVEKHVLEISRRMIKDGHKIIVITENHGNRHHEKIEGIEVYRLNVGGDNWFKKFRIWSELLNHISVLSSADIIHCHDVFFWYLPFRFLFLTKKIYTTFHGYEKFPVPSRQIVVRKIAEKLSRGNICVGEYIHSWFDTNPTYITYGGVTPFPLEMKEKITSDALFVGRLEQNTGILEYKRVVEMVRSTHPSFSFTIVGEGPLYPDVEHMAKMEGVQEHIGRYLYSTKYVFTSGYLSMLEAMAAKKLVFALYDNFLKRDYLEESPFGTYAVIDGTAESLAKKILFFMDNPKEAEERIEAAYEWAISQTWENVVKIYYALWQK